MEKIRKLDRLFSQQEAKMLDQNAIKAGVSSMSLMQTAGLRSAQKAMSIVPDIFSCVVFAGPGHNGGDAWIMARHLGLNDIPVLVVELTQNKKQSPERISARHQAIDEEGIQIDCLSVHENTLIDSLNETLISWLDTQLDRFEAQSKPNNSLLIVDGLFGIGLNQEINGFNKEIIETINHYQWFRNSVMEQMLNPFILALDIPSGIDATTGQALGACVQADATLTFIVPKQGLYRDAGKSCAGHIYTEHLNLNIQHLDNQHPKIMTYEPSRIPGRIHRGQGNSHKGTYGTLVSIGGDFGMGGAILLAAEAGALMGAGRSVIISHESNCHAALTRSPHIITEYKDEKAKQKWLTSARAIVVGPGMGQGQWGKDCLDMVLNFDQPTLFDADALNIIAQDQKLRQKYLAWVEKNPYRSIMTPHPKEAMRLMPNIEDPFQLAMAISDTYKCYCVLKGHGTLIAHKPSNTILLCPTGNGALAKAGQGDTLAGMIGAFIAQGWSLLDAAAISVWSHGRAADVWVVKESDLSLLPQKTAGLAARQLKYHMNKKN